MLDSDEISSFETVLDVNEQGRRIKLTISLEIGKFGEVLLFMNSYKFYVNVSDEISKNFFGIQ